MSGSAFPSKVFAVCLFVAGLALLAAPNMLPRAIWTHRALKADAQPAPPSIPGARGVR